MVKRGTMQLSPALIRRRRERWFYMLMTLAIIITVFAGFAPTYYLRPAFTTSPLMPLLHFHGLVFTSWIALLLVQTTLVAKHRVDVHRKLGIAGFVLATLMVFVGIGTALIRAKQGAAPVGGINPLSFLVVPLGDMFVFAILIAAGFYFRRRPDTHKRLMLLATIGILAAAVARLPFRVVQSGPLGFFAVTDIFILPLVAYDLITMKRIHRATLFGGLFIIASQPLRLLVAGTPAWISFAGWLVSLVP